MVMVASGPRRVEHEVPRPGETNVARPERIASVIGGGALAVEAIRRGGVPGLALAVLGGILVQRGATGHCPVYGSLGMSTAARSSRRGSPIASLDASNSVKVQRSVTIDRPREQLYAFWRDFRNLPQIMEHLESVHILSRDRSHWVARGPAGRSVEWDAVIHNEVPNERIAWRSVDPADVANAGTVIFRDVGEGRTQLTVELEYAPPAGRLGVAVARLLGEEPDLQVREDLQRFKEMMEAGR